MKKKQIGDRKSKKEDKVEKEKKNKLSRTKLIGNDG